MAKPEIHALPAGRAQLTCSAIELKVIWTALNEYDCLKSERPILRSLISALSHYFRTSEAP